MKEITRNILPFQENYFFSPIRRNIDYVKLLIYASRLILIDQQIPSNKNNCKMKLVIAKMSRLFFFKDQKYFSVAFPFKIYVEKNKVNGIETYGGKIVDNKSISGILAILNDTQFNLNNSLIEYYKELEDS